MQQTCIVKQSRQPSRLLHITCMHARPDCYYPHGALITHAQASARRHVLMLNPVSCCSNGVMEMTRGVRSQLQGLIRYPRFQPTIKSLATTGFSCVCALCFSIGSVLGAGALCKNVLTMVAVKFAGMLRPVVCHLRMQLSNRGFSNDPFVCPYTWVPHH